MHIGQCCTRFGNQTKHRDLKCRISFFGFLLTEQRSLRTYTLQICAKIFIDATHDEQFVLIEQSATAFCRHFIENVEETFPATRCEIVVTDIQRFFAAHLEYGFASVKSIQIHWLLCQQSFVAFFLREIIEAVLLAKHIYLFDQNLQKPISNLNLAHFGIDFD